MCAFLMDNAPVSLILCLWNTYILKCLDAYTCMGLILIVKLLTSLCSKAIRKVLWLSGIFRSTFRHKNKNMLMWCPYRAIKHL